MREIKFRAWHKKIMYNVSTFGFNTSGIYSNMSFAHKGLGNDFMPEDDTCVSFDFSTIFMQFTGREDAGINGTEVWENDIIENCDTKDLQAVYWNENESAWFCRYIDQERNKDRIISLADSLGNLNKVVGNIHENANLLN